MPQIFLVLQRDALVEVIAEPVPQGAVIVARGVTEQGDFYLDLDHESFTSTDPLCPLLRSVKRPATEEGNA